MFNFNKYAKYFKSYWQLEDLCNQGWGEEIYIFITKENLT